MSENQNNQTPKTFTPEEIAETVRKGGMKLAQPLLANNVEHTELKYDFGLLTGWDFVNAMDSDLSGKSNAFRLTARQEFALFAAAVNKCMPDIDAEDLRQRMSIDDAIKATQLAATFFNFTSKAGNARMLS